MNLCFRKVDQRKEEIKEKLDDKVRFTCPGCKSKRVNSLSDFTCTVQKHGDIFCSEPCYVNDLRHRQGHDKKNDEKDKIDLVERIRDSMQVKKLSAETAFIPQIPIDLEQNVMSRQAECLKLEPLQPILEPPIDIASRYEIDSKERIIRADLSPILDEGKEISNEEIQFLSKCMERADQTLIVKGAACHLTSYMWYWPYILKRCGGLMYHHFKCFVMGEGNNFDNEETWWRSMTLRDYDSYLQTRKTLLATCDQSSFSSCLEKVSITDCEGRVHHINPLKECIYLLDFALPIYLPELHADFVENYALPFLPAGKNCLLRYVPEVGRPFMGPNLYIAPPGAFTWFHEDGHGTVDSGHQSLTGRNEVIVLRRMDEGNKQAAINILSNNTQNLRTKPHDSGVKPSWPKAPILDRLKACEYSASHFILEAGEYVHINKGRIHAFRKMKPANQKEDQGYCVSVAWDWMYQGISKTGIQNEALYALESAENNHNYLVASLGISQTAVLNAIKCSIAAFEAKQSVENVICDYPCFDKCWIKQKKQKENSVNECSKENHNEEMFCHKSNEQEKDDNESIDIKHNQIEKEIQGKRNRKEEISLVKYENEKRVLAGLSPSLQKILDIEGRKIDYCTQEENRALRNSRKRKRPIYHIDTWVSPLVQVIDPFTLDGFNCRVCKVELANIYKHCIGCEELLNSDFNICVDCHALKYFGDSDAQSTATGHRPLKDLKQRKKSIGSSKKSYKKLCSCTLASCERCLTCPLCACACHNEFETHYRFEPPGSLDELKVKVEEIIHE